METKLFFMTKDTNNKSLKKLNSEYFIFIFSKDKFKL